MVCAESSSDYVAVNVELTFASCDTQLCVSVRITDDLISEPDEMLAVSLTTPTDSLSFITLSSVAAEVVIILKLPLGLLYRFESSKLIYHANDTNFHLLLSH